MNWLKSEWQELIPSPPISLLTAPPTFSDIRVIRIGNFLFDLTCVSLFKKIKSAYYSKIIDKYIELITIHFIFPKVYAKSYLFDNLSVLSRLPDSIFFKNLGYVLKND